MTRLHQILIGILAAQLVLVGLVFFLPRPGQATAAPLLGEVKAEDITSLVIWDDQGKTIRLAKTASGWVLPEAGDFPADTAKITPVTVKLAGLKTGRLVAQNEANFKRLQVADDTFQRKIEIGTAGGAPRILYLGSSAGGRATHMRLGDGKDVYIGADLTAYDVNADAASWINAGYVEVPQADITSLTLANANGQFVFEKNAQGQWTMQGLRPGEVFSTNNFSTVLTYASSIRMTKPLGRTDESTYGMAQPSAVVTLKTTTGGQEQTRTLTIGARDAVDSSYVIKWSESPYFVKVADYSVKDLVERSKANFLQQPTPAPGASATPTPKP
jgi:hypothetical protein